MFYRCYRNTSLSLPFDYPSDETVQEKVTDQQYYDNCMKRSSELREAEYQHNRYLHLDSLADLTFVKSNLGTGKTE